MGRDVDGGCCCKPGPSVGTNVFSKMISAWLANAMKPFGGDDKLIDTVLVQSSLISILHTRKALMAPWDGLGLGLIIYGVMVLSAS